MTKLTEFQRATLRQIAKNQDYYGHGETWPAPYVDNFHRLASSRTAAALYRAGVIEPVSMGTCRVTDKGRQLLEGK